MKPVTLLHTRKKLSLYFAMIVFCIVLFLGVLFLSVRYINEQRLEKSRFINQSQSLLQTLQTRPNLNNQATRERFDADFIKKRPSLNGPNQVSYLLLDSDNNIIDKKILQNIDFNIFSQTFKTWLWSDKGLVFRKEYLKSSSGINRLIMYSKYRMDFQDYARDVWIYFVLALCCAIGFYYIGLLFVAKTLKPVAENIDDMQQFIHNAGHELKTPLAVIDSNLQLLSSMKDLDVSLVWESRHEVHRLNWLLESLIDLADISRSTQTQKIDIQSEIQSIVAEHTSYIEEKNIRIHIDFKKPILLEANPWYAQIFFSNLIENALKYNREGWSVHVSYDGDTLSISDTGIGMDQQQQVKIFDRFYQINKNQNTPWFGIWLSLVAKIAEIYSWKISLESEVDKGSQFNINF